MEIMTISQISPDQVIFWHWGFITINATLVFTWLVMAILVIGSWLVTRNLSPDHPLLALADLSGSHRLGDQKRDR